MNMEGDGASMILTVGFLFFEGLADTFLGLVDDFFETTGFESYSESDSSLKLGERLMADMMWEGARQRSSDDVPK